MKFSSIDFWGIKQDIEVGDRVRVIDSGEIGVVVKVTQALSTGSNVYSVKFDDKTRYRDFFFRDELELIP